MVNSNPFSESDYRKIRDNIIDVWTICREKLEQMQELQESDQFTTPQCRAQFDELTATLYNELDRLDGLVEQFPFFSGMVALMEESLSEYEEEYYYR